MPSDKQYTPPLTVNYILRVSEGHWRPNGHPMEAEGHWMGVQLDVGAFAEWRSLIVK